MKIPLSAYLIVLGVIALIFCTYEIAERVWLIEADTDIIHLLHIIRGVGTSIVIGLLVGWYILRKTGSIFPQAQAEPSEFAEEKDILEARAIHFNLWFIKMRWMACVVSIALIVVTIKSLGYLEEEVFLPLIMSVAFLAGSNVIYDLLLRRRALSWYLREMQMASDLVILTVMLHYSGGIENPLFLAYIFHVIISGILLNRRKCYTIVIMSLVLFGTMALLEMSGTVGHYTLAIFPHGDEASHITHAAHMPLYVFSVVGLHFIIMLLTAYFITNIMDRLRFEESHAREVGQRLKRVLQASGAGFTILDRQLRPLWMNKQIRAWLNISDKDIEKAPNILAEWTGGENGPANETLRDGRVRIVERQRVGPDGNKHFYQVTIAPLIDSRGKVYQAVELVQDNTEQKRLKAEMMHSSKMASLGVMAAGVAHEIGNPLASISARLRLLKEQHDEKFLGQSIELLENEIGRIGRILHGVSQLARPNKSGWNIYHINSIVKESLDILKLDRRAKHCRIESDLSKQMLQTTGSRDELLQVFLNLGLNALEKMPNGGILTVQTTASQGEIRVSFTDTGQGMSEEVLSKVFTPFFTTKPEGLGLGLYIAYNIINAHDGRIEVKSKVGIGTTITVILPM